MVFHCRSITNRYRCSFIHSPLFSGEEGEGYDSTVEDSRQRLLDNSERLERSGKKLDTGYKVCVETEEIGNKILGRYRPPCNGISRVKYTKRMVYLHYYYHDYYHYHY